MKKADFICSLVLPLILFASFAYAGWQEGSIVVNGSYGKSLGQFGFESADPEDAFPRDFLIDDKNNILISDSVNLRVIVYKVNGDVNDFTFKEVNVDWPLLLWPSQQVGISGDLFVDAGTALYQFYDYQGNLVNQFDVPDTVFMAIAKDSNLIINHIEKEEYYKYTPQGALIKTYTGKPLELGVIKANTRQRDGKYKTVVQFEDGTYSVISQVPFDEFHRDQTENLLAHTRVGVGEKTVKRVYKFDKCGKELGMLDLPEDNIVEVNDFPSNTPPPPTSFFQYNAEYGEPVIAPNGDVYTWKRSDTSYSILKWAWVDEPTDPKGGPDTPEEVQALPSNSGIYLTWNPAPQDPGCVSGYEIERASAAGGPYSPVATVPLDEKQTYNYNDTTAGAGATWYYRIRSTSDIGNSDPAEVSAARP